MSTYSLPKEQRLTGRTAIDSLFAKGAGGFVYPLRYVVLADRLAVPGVSVLFVVPKRAHKRAIRRNLLKRRMREAYRTQSGPLKEVAEDKNIKVNIALLYSAKEVEDYRKIADAVGKILTQVAERV